MSDWVYIAFWGTLLLLLLIVWYEWTGHTWIEGFEGGLGSSYLANFLPRRGDLGPELEMNGLLRDKRYFSGYADEQRFGIKQDFCRMVQEGSDEKNKFFACGLAGTENLSSTSFRTLSVRDGFQLSRDDYMRDTTGQGREDYCRILKNADGTFDAKCNLATDFGFQEDLSLDTAPPEDIQRLLTFYAGCVFWLRFRDDMVDYAQNLYLNKAGSIEVDEDEVNPPVTRGLTFNGEDQFLRIGDDSYLQLGGDVPLRSLRAICFWVKFDEFTNNAHIFDFGNGPGMDNIFAGIIGRGNAGATKEAAATKRLAICGAETTVPECPSGAQDVPDMAPQRLMKTTDANVEEWSCTQFAVAPNVPPKKSDETPKGEPETADLLYEIWQSNQRKLHMVVPQCFEKGQWVHIAITAESNDAFRPNLLVYKNGKLAFIQPNGWLPQAGVTKKNYLGKSNWADQTSQYGNRDELFKGALFDFRGYTTVLSEKVVQDSVAWGKGMLGTKVE